MIEFTVAPDDAEKYKVTAESRDIVVWERTGKGKSFASLMDDLRMTEMYRVAHIASRRQGLYDGTLPEFEAGVNLEFDVDMDGPDPTPPGASASA